MTRPHVYRDSGCFEQGVACCIVYGSRTFPPLIICRAVSLSIERGNNDGSCLTYVVVSDIAGHRFGDYKRCISIRHSSAMIWLKSVV